MNISAGALGVEASAPTGKYIVPRQQGIEIPLSFEQEQIWLHTLLAEGLPLYNETATLRYRGNLDLPALERSLNEVIRRHEILRTNIVATNGIAHQVIHAERSISIERSDITPFPMETREAAAARIASDFAAVPFHLATDPLLRALSIEVSDNDHRIYLTMHHLVFDGASLRQVFMPELTALYAAFSNHRPSPLVDPGLHYGDYCCWQQTTEKGPRTESIHFWKAELAGLRSLTLPTDRPRTPQTSLKGAALPIALRQDLTDALRQFSRREGSTLFNVLLSSFIVLLARSSDEEDVAIATIYGGRTRSEMNSMIGCFVNTLILRTQLSDNPNFREVLRKVRQTTLSALEHADTPFQEVVRELECRGEGEPVILSSFAYQPPLSILPPEWSLDVFEISSGTAKFDLSLELEERSHDLVGRFIFNSDLFDQSTVTAMADRFVLLLQAAIREPNRSMWELPVLTREEERLFCSLNDTCAGFPDKCIHELISQQAAITPDRIAVSMSKQTLTYAEVEDKSTRLAQYLTARVKRSSRFFVAVMVERSPDMLVALLGIVKAGGTYVPLDPRYPAARLRLMMSSADTDLVITQGSLIASLPSAQCSILSIDEFFASISSQQSDLPPLALVASSTPAYVIFTSGSTGEPKGVVISHRSLANLLWSVRKEPGIRCEDIFLACTSICFDIAAVELFLPLLVGARVEMSTADETATPTLLSEKIRESGATLMQATPTAWRMLIESGWGGSPKLKMITCGEPLTETLAGQLLQRCESLWNLYGPTETTIYSTCTRVTTSVAPISLGSPIANTTLFILDSHQNPVPPGVPGELYIAGDGLAEGYLNKPEKTSERFKMLSIHGTTTARMYQTGDRVKRLRDGTLLFLGRTDKQVKLRGFRIELGEIEHALNQLAGVQESFVVKLDHKVRGEMLAAYVLPQAGCYLDADRLRAELDNSLPEPMRPSAIRIIDRVPLSPNGKLDRKQLPDPLPDHSEIASEAPHPGVEQVLAKIWCDILQISNIGRHDNFFHLGGHSLLAARLVARIGVRFGNNLSLASLVQAPTVARLALILKGASLPSSSCIKSGRPEGKQLLWIGAEPWLPRLAKSLGNKTGLQAFTLNPDSIRTFGPEFKMQDMASHLAYRICELQPHGPYLLGGFCLNGLLAYETAQQLRLMGQHIDLLVIGDVFAPTDLQRHSTHELVRKRLQAELREFLTVLNSESREWRTYSRRRLEKFQETIERLRWQGNSRTKSIFKDLPQTLQAALYVAELRYKPGVFPGRVLFLQASEERNYRNQTTSASWKAFVRDIEVFEYLGEHSDLFEEMALRRAAEAIERAIDLGLSARCNNFAACTPNQPYPFL